MATITEKREHAKEIFSTAQSIRAFFNSKEGFDGIEYDSFKKLFNRVQKVQQELDQEQKAAEAAAEAAKKAAEEKAKQIFEIMKDEDGFTMEQAYAIVLGKTETTTSAQKGTRKSSERIEFTYMVNGQPEKAKRLTNTIKDELQKVKKGASNDEAYLLVAKEDQEAYLEFAIQQPRFSKQLEAMAKHFGLDLEAAKEKVKAEKKN